MSKINLKYLHEVRKVLNLRKVNKSETYFSKLVKSRKS